MRLPPIILRRTFPALLALLLASALGLRADPRLSAFAEGGTASLLEEAGKTYVVHTFTTVGTTNFTVKVDGLEVEYLVVAGGGAGGAVATVGGAGGGGAGGMRSNVGQAPLTVSVGSFPVVVGAGGAPGGQTIAGGNGSPSSIGSLVSAVGGGGGASVGDDARNGGSGGGGARGTTVRAFGTGTAGEGNDGGAGGGNNLPRAGGGGGGKATAGVDAGGTTGGDGGAGQTNDITGTSLVYAGGGGGGVSVNGGTVAGAGGAGGGGAGALGGPGVAGTNGLGGGGGGAGGSGAGTEVGGAGGSGIVILRYELVTSLDLTGSPTIMVGAPVLAGAPPATTVVSDNARLRWVSLGTNKIEVRRDALSAIPQGVKLFVQLGSGSPVEVPAGGSWTPLLASTTDTAGDETLTYSVTLDPVSDVVATAAVSVDLEYRIGP